MISTSSDQDDIYTIPSVEMNTICSIINMIETIWNTLTIEEKQSELL